MPALRLERRASVLSRAQLLEKWCNDDSFCSYGELLA